MKDRPISGYVVNPVDLGIGHGESPKKYSDEIGYGLGDEIQGLSWISSIRNQPSLFGYFFGNGKSIGITFFVAIISFSKSFIWVGHEQDA